MFRKTPRTLPVLLALFLLMLMGGEGFWHHHKGGEESGCAVCQFHKTGNATAPAAPPVLSEPVRVSSRILEAAGSVVSVDLHFPSGRSPPTAS